MDLILVASDASDTNVNIQFIILIALSLELKLNRLDRQNSRNGPDLTDMWLADIYYRTSQSPNAQQRLFFINWHLCEKLLLLEDIF